MRVVLLVAVLGCTGLPDPEKPRKVEYAQAFVAARDAASVRKFLGSSVVNGGLLFANAACMRQFASPGEITGPRLDAFASCLASLHLTLSERRDQLWDVVVMEYEPGIEVEARFIEKGDEAWLAWIGYAGRRDDRDALPTITKRALESLRTAGDPKPAIELTGLERDFAVTDPVRIAYAWVKLCLDVNGGVTAVHVRDASSAHAARLFTDAVKQWQFRPFAMGTQPLPVCSLVFMHTPARQKPFVEALPLPLPPTPTELMFVPSLERRAGEKMIAPDDRFKTLMQKANVHRVRGLFRYCIDETGHVDDIQRLRSTGLQNYDDKIQHAIATWIFAPYLDDDGKAIPVCSSVMFVYTQK